MAEKHLMLISMHYDLNKFMRQDFHAFKFLELPKVSNYTFYF